MDSNINYLGMRNYIEYLVEHEIITKEDALWMETQIASDIRADIKLKKS